VTRKRIRLYALLAACALVSGALGFLLYRCSAGARSRQRRRWSLHLWKGG